MNALRLPAFFFENLSHSNASGMDALHLPALVENLSHSNVTRTLGGGVYSTALDRRAKVNGL